MTYQCIYRVKNDTYIKNDKYNCNKVKKQDKLIGLQNFSGKRACAVDVTAE